MRNPPIEISTAAASSTSGPVPIPRTPIAAALYDHFARGGTIEEGLRLVEALERAGTHANEVARLASDYVAKNGFLDSKFNNILRDYNQQHPMFSGAEMRDIRLVAPPVAPRLETKEQAREWAARAGVKPGDPVKIPGYDKPKAWVNP